METLDAAPAHIDRDRGHGPVLILGMNMRDMPSRNFPVMAKLPCECPCLAHSPGRSGARRASRKYRLSPRDCSIAA
jgi:hypothetical protein